MECIKCKSISISEIDKGVFYCSNCKTTFSFCEKCRAPYETKSDPRGTHLCEECGKK